ncbi:MAG: PepSY-like domain-containing protein [Prevotella sp.]|nr:PepSY-like domain-containing protein [Prevotella sp.]
MKKAKILVSTLIALMAQSVETKACEHLVFANNLPEATKLFLCENFPEKSVSFAELDVENYGEEYAVSFNDGTEMSFNIFGTWEKVDCKLFPVPASLLPTRIADFVSTSFANEEVVRINKTYDGFRVLLTNNVELKFDHQGNIC